jgi:hypothetical protein
LRRLALLATTFALAALAVGIIAGTPAAQTSPEVRQACRPDRATISAGSLPETVRLENCPVGERVIRDNGIGTFFPAPGQGIYVEALTTEGSQELEVTHYRNGTVELSYVGDDTEAAQGEPQVGTASSPGECSDGTYNALDRKVYANLRWYFNPRTVPQELARKGAVEAIRRGTANITGVQDRCGVRDRVKWGMSYEGSTRATAQVTTNNNCVANDGKTVVSFGTLPEDTMAFTCTVLVPTPGPNNDRVKWSDIMINKAHRNWTTRPGSPNCRGRYDLESTITHERGHTFGLGHVSESSHRNLTMSDRSNGPCQSSERSLGRGDAKGLNSKYKKRR